MEGFYWVRLGAIGALILGALYVLLPNVFAEEEAVPNATADRATTAADSFDLRLDATGDPAALAEALIQRQAAASVSAEVTAEETGLLVEARTPTDRDLALDLATTKGEAAVYAAKAVVTLPAPGSVTEVVTPVAQPVLDALGASAELDQLFWGEVLGRVAAAGAVPDTAQPAFTVTGTTMSEGRLIATLEPADARTTPAVLTLDGAPAAAILPDGQVVPLTEGPQARVTVGVVSGGALPGTLAKAVEVVEEARSDSDAAQAPTAPPWLQGMLLDNRIKYGLDLQGGVDLTLQVELDQAVLSQVRRDATSLKDAAARDNDVSFEAVRRGAAEPVIEVVTDLPREDVDTFLRSRLGPEYLYDSTDGRMLTYRMRDERQEEVQKQAVEQVLETLRKRVDQTGVKEPSIVRKGGGRINIQLPGEKETQAAIDAIGTTAVLEFRMVDHDFDISELEQILMVAEDRMPGTDFYDDDALNRWLWDTKRLEADRIVVWTEPGNQKMLDRARLTFVRRFNDEGQELRGEPYVLRNEVPLTGNDINNATVQFDQNNQAGVSLEFKAKGGQIFCELTGQAVGKDFAIILDNFVQSTPRINEQICGGGARIDMASAGDPLRDARNLALVLRTGALNAPVDVGSVRLVGAALGDDSINKGTLGAAVGAIIVLVFMAAWYRTSGIIADFALVVNVLLVFAALALTGATLTLPGIAGIALTVGMSVDANIIVYERIREELRLGVQPRKAVDAGFDKALVAVLDANITTAIAGIVLFSYGTGPIKGFAVTLLIGIATTLISALFVTRTVMELVTRSSSARLRI